MDTIKTAAIFVASFIQNLTAADTSLVSLLLASSFLRSFGNFALASFTLLHRLYHADGNRLPHVTHGKTTERSVIGERLDTHRLLWNHLDDGSVSRLDVRWIVLQLLTAATINLLQQLTKLAGNVRRVTVKHWCVASIDLPWMVQYNHL